MRCRCNVFCHSLQASAQASAAPIADAKEAQDRESDEQYVAHLVGLMMTRVKAQEEGTASSPTLHTAVPLASCPARPAQHLQCLDLLTL